jgi:hypothetical protein
LDITNDLNLSTMTLNGDIVHVGGDAIVMDSTITATQFCVQGGITEIGTSSTPENVCP